MRTVLIALALVVASATGAGASPTVAEDLCSFTKSHDVSDAKARRKCGAPADAVVHRTYKRDKILFIVPVT